MEEYKIKIKLKIAYLDEIKEKAKSTKNKNDLLKLVKLEAIQY